MKEPNIVTRFVAGKAIDRTGIGISDVCEFAEVRVAVFMLDK